ncbi:MAG TPA: type I polyketide synthase, partial [Anaerolineales bacterium]|nr:type I polyketide synthase [Anaerolineales bacterium]
MGPTYTVDAACASSLVAVDIATRDLLTGQCDLALVGGVQVTTPIPILTLFSHLNALSRKQEIRPFDQNADGTLLAEGLGVVVLKRAVDAVRDGDRIYAVIKGVGTSSDGKGLGVLAPRLEGATLAMRRAYENTGISPKTIGLIEAHGTGTSAGDLSEMTALRQVYGNREGHYAYCAVGSVKSMIGHTMPAAGIAGLIKAALALHHKILPPTLNYDEPNPKFDLPSAPFYINTETRPWIHPARYGVLDQQNGSETLTEDHRSSTHPRRAGVNAFGFGGINAHVILEEFPDVHETASPALLSDWDSEVIFLEADSRQQLIEQAQTLQLFLETHPESSLLDLAYTFNHSVTGRPSRLSVVATSTSDLHDKLALTLKRLNEPTRNQIKDRNGIYYFEQPFYTKGSLALLFPGEGSQYPNMLADLYYYFPEVREVFDFMDSLFQGHPRGYLPSDYIFAHPRPKSSDPSEETIWQTDVSVEAVLTANRALWTLLTHLGIQPDVLVGHSTGEYSALHAAGMIPLSEEVYLGEHLMTLNHIYHDQLSRDKDVPRAVLIAVGAGLDKVGPLLEDHEGKIYVGMDNCPHQTVLAVELSSSPAFTAQLRAQGLIFEILPFDRAYHTPLFAPYSHAQRHFFEHLPVQAARVPLYSCTTATRFPDEPDAIREVAMQHWTDTVRFRETVLQMYKDGARIFVEVGANTNLTGFVDDTLRGQPHLAIPSNSQHQTGLTQLHHLLAMLGAQGVPMNLDTLYQRRRTLLLDLTAEPEMENKKRSGTIKIPTGWAGMSIGPEVAAQLRRKSDISRHETVPDQPLAPAKSPSPINGSGAPSAGVPARVAPVFPTPGQGTRTQAMQVHF